MSNQKEMTKAEVVEGLRCFAQRYRDGNAKICENCSYIDFCWDLEKVIDRKPKKYI